MAKFDVDPENCTVDVSRVLLGRFGLEASVIDHLNETHGRRLPKQGERGLKRRQRKARRKALATRLQRVSWCSYYEAQR